MTSMQKSIPITVAKGDGIGPEIMDATLFILKEATSSLEIHEIEVGEKAYLKGFTTGIDPNVWEVIRSTKAFLKAPITTPQGGGYKSLNVTIRTTLGLYANVRPCVSYHPFIRTKHPKMDLVIIRENEEDLYSGIEYQHTPNVCESIKLISRQGTEKIARYAFEYAKKNGRKKVTCFAKDNIMKLSDGLFRKVFEEVAKEYSDIEQEYWIVDIGAAKMADTPEMFDVIVLPNLYGDILSDVGAQISGSVGLVGSANIGDHGAMFEAIHGSAPRRANQNAANPSALILASLLMLNHVGLSKEASLIHNAWLTTIEKGIHTYDIFHDQVSKKKVGTKEFAEAVVSNFGKKPEKLKPVHYKSEKSFVQPKLKKTPETKRALIGSDIYIYAKPPLDSFLAKVEKLTTKNLALSLVTNRGAKLWPDGQPETFCIDHFRLRFTSKDKEVLMSEVIEMVQKVEKAGLDIIKIENLYTFDEKKAFSQAEG